MSKLSRKGIINKFDAEYSGINELRNKILKNVKKLEKDLKELSKSSNKFIKFIDKNCYEEMYGKGIVPLDEFDNDFVSKVCDIEYLCEIMESYKSLVEDLTKYKQE